MHPLQGGAGAGFTHYFFLFFFLQTHLVHFLFHIPQASLQFHEQLILLCLLPTGHQILKNKLLFPLTLFAFFYPSILLFLLRELCHQFLLPVEHLCNKNQQ